RPASARLTPSSALARLTRISAALGSTPAWSVGAGAAGPQQPAQGLQPGRCRGTGRTRGGPGIEPAVRLVMRAAARALGGTRLEVGEMVHDPVDVDVRQPERAHPGGVDDPAAGRPGEL